MPISVVTVTDNEQVLLELEKNEWKDLFFKAKRNSESLFQYREKDTGYVYAYMDREQKGKINLFLGFDGFNSLQDNGYVWYQIIHTPEEEQKALGQAKLILDQFDHVYTYDLDGG